jgi:hypothetical protein
MMVAVVVRRCVLLERYVDRLLQVCNSLTTSLRVLSIEARAGNTSFRTRMEFRLEHMGNSLLRQVILHGPIRSST